MTDSGGSTTRRLGLVMGIAVAQLVHASPPSTLHTAASVATHVRILLFRGRVCGDSVDLLGLASLRALLAKFRQRHPMHPAQHDKRFAVHCRHATLAPIGERLTANVEMRLDAS